MTGETAVGEGQGGPVTDVDVLVIGSGFSGIGMGVALKREEVAASLEELEPRRIFVDAELAGMLDGAEGGGGAAGASGGEPSAGDRWRERRIVVDVDAGPGVTKWNRAASSSKTMR